MGEIIAENIAPDSLHMSFSPEAVRANKTIQSFDVVIDDTACYLLEELTRNVSAHKALVDSKRNPMTFPDARRPRVGQ
jgi:hypothetical protein